MTSRVHPGSVEEIDIAAVRARLTEAEDRRFRAEPGADRVLLVALTGYGSSNDRERSKQAGFDHHLTKPVDPDALRSLLGGHL